MTIINKQIVLASRPEGAPRENNFRLVETPLRVIGDGEFLVRNLYISLDAGFRNWMNEGSGDNVLPAMELDAPVMGLTLGRVTESRRPDFKPGDLFMVRRAWEQYSICDGSEWSSQLPENPSFPLSYYLGILGDTGLSAYFGLTDIGKPQPGETVLITAAGGAVGSVVGQIARLKGARTVGIAGSEEKCRRLVQELGYDEAINRRGAEGFDSAVARACPQGIDVYFDNIGGSMLETALAHLAPGARVVLCGAVANYGATEPVPGPGNLFELVTKEAKMEGFMCHFRHNRYGEARRQLGAWMQSGQLKSIEYMLDGIENTARAFCEMFQGKNFGKTVIRVFPDE